MKNLGLVYCLTILVFLIYMVNEQKISAKEPNFAINAVDYYQQTKDNSLGLPRLDALENTPASIDKIKLGRKLFMDRRLSHNNTISCAMCHVPEQGFTVNQLATAVGIEGRSNRRNAPTILNVGFYQHLFHDGRESSLENQVLGPLLNFNEMGNPSVGFVLDKIKQFPDYEGSFEAVYDQPVNLTILLDAIAAYERTLISGNSKFDRWYYAKDKSAFNTIEEKGFQLFIGKAKCISCHTIGKNDALLTDQSFHNTGVGWAANNKVYKNKTFPVQLAPGVIVQVEHDRYDDISEKTPNDVGRFEITEDPQDSWLYKTPTLRNIALTAPYMHNGALSTLREVVSFYNQGGEDNPFKDKQLTKLHLTEEEELALVAFLKTLTGANVEQLTKEAREAYLPVMLENSGKTDYQ